MCLCVCVSPTLCPVWSGAAGRRRPGRSSMRWWSWWSWPRGSSWWPRGTRPTETGWRSASLPRSDSGRGWAAGRERGRRTINGLMQHGHIHRGLTIMNLWPIDIRETFSSRRSNNNFGNDSYYQTFMTKKCNWGLMFYSFIKNFILNNHELIKQKNTQMCGYTWVTNVQKEHTEWVCVECRCFSVPSEQTAGSW